MPEGPVVLEENDTPGHPMSPWFADARRIRREHYAGRTSHTPKRTALLTLVQNEAYFLPIFLGYYSRFFAAEDIYVIDHDTTDGSTDRGGFVRLPVSHDTFDVPWMVQTVQEQQHELLDSYEAVLVADVDEIVAPNPEWGTLGDYLERFDERWVNCLGYEILHFKDEEPPLDRDRPVLEQRRFWYPNDAYDKPALASEKQTWRLGLHGRADNHFNLDPDLRMIHLHRVDFDHCLERHQRWRERTWSERNRDRGLGVHIRERDEADFERWFYEDSAFSGIKISVEEIPPAWRTVF